ncbi:MAG: hypothetical protein Q7T80_16550 [Methanoregula sp.]|nr:hypothetical protein [Methanoregula sp.]
MTINTTPTPAAAKGRESRRKTIFSMMGITLLLALLVVSFAQAAGNDNLPVCDSMKGDVPREHIISCTSSDGSELGLVILECPFGGVNGFDTTKDLQACVQFYGTSVTLATPVTPCGIQHSNNHPLMEPGIRY